MTATELTGPGLLDWLFSIIPCKRDTGTKADKEPIYGFSWTEYQRRLPTRAEVEQWRVEYFPCNWAIVTGAVSGIVVLDIDSEEGEAEVVRRGGVPETVSVQSAHGRHLYFRHPGQRCRNWVKQARDRNGVKHHLPGLDLRGDGGYVMAPGSKHPEGVLYEWIITPEDMEYADLPEWLLEFAVGPPEIEPPAAVERKAVDPGDDPYMKKVLETQLETLSKAGAGGRYMTLNNVALTLGGYVGIGALDESMVRSELIQIAMRLDRPDNRFELSEIMRAIDNGLRDGRAKPLTIPKSVERRLFGSHQSPSTNGHARSQEAGETSVHDVAESTGESVGDTSGHVLHPLIYFPDWDNRPPATKPVLKLHEARIGSAGNVTSIVAPPSAGKSAVCEAIGAQHLVKQRGGKCDSFSIEVDVQGEILLIDTERSKEDHWVSWYRMLRRAGLSNKKEPITEVTFALFKLVPTVKDRIKALEHLVTDRQVGLLMLDGIGDFVRDVNDAAEVADLSFWLLALAETRGMAVLTTIHPNPDSPQGKPRGHLGSEFLRRCETNLTLKRDRKTGQRTLTTFSEHGKVRNDEEKLETYFAWDDAAKMFMSCENEVVVPRPEKQRQLVEVIETVYASRISLTYTELVQAIIVASGKSENAAKKIISKAQDENLIYRDTATKLYYRNGNEDPF